MFNLFKYPRHIAQAFVARPEDNANNPFVLVYRCDCRLSWTKEECREQHWPIDKFSCWSMATLPHQFGSNRAEVWEHPISYSNCGERVSLPEDFNGLVAPYPLSPLGTRITYIDLSRIMRVSAWADPLGHGLVATMKVHEVLRCHPHPNIEGYHGCIIEQGTLHAICTERGGWSLKMALRRGFSFDPKMVIFDCWQAVNHIHQLGLVHNNISPSTLIVTADGRGILTDFANCRKVGQPRPVCSPFSNRGTITSKANDIYAIQMVQRWIARVQAGSEPWTPEDKLEMLVEEALFDSREFFDMIHCSVFQ